MIYFFDGTNDGFLTAFLCSYYDANAQFACDKTQLSIGQECITVKTDAETAHKAKERFMQLDGDCLGELDLLLRSGEENKSQIAYRYMKLISEYKRPVRGMLANEDVLQAANCIQRVTVELHRLRGFIRFMESESGALYAPFSPDHDICDLLLPHFRARLPKHPFVLHDIARKKAAVYDGAHSFTAPLDRAEIALSANEEEWQKLWKRYYDSVNIPSRERLKQMRGYMPVRYWKFLPERVPK